ncbi:MAG: DEAD/DEAH box helicase [Bacteroidota bacterium]
MTDFSSLGLSGSILKVLPELGIEKPTEIQEKTIPFLLENQSDFIGLAQTGTGKTAAFGLPLLQNVDPDLKHVQALVLAPTRELCQQIEKQLSLFSKYISGIHSTAVFGGANIMGQIKTLRKPNQIVVATPGRLIDLAKRKAIRLDQIEYLVLDEADEMLNMGFKDELDEILSFTPETKITWLFSATMPSEIKRIVDEYMVDPEEVRVSTGNAVNANIAHQYVVVRSADKKEAIRRFIDKEIEIKGIVFTRTKMDAQKLSDDLGRDGYRVDALHGDLSQAQRDRVMNKFKEHNLQLLIATDVAARGIDVNDLTHVFHHSIPDQLEYYTHRSGRTARGGKKGISLAITTKRDKRRIGYLENDLDISFDKVEVPTSSEILFNRITSWVDHLPAKEAIDVSEISEMEDTLSKLKKYTKEELIFMMVKEQMRKLNLNTKHEDINDKGDSDRKKKKDRKNSENGDFRGNEKKVKKTIEGNQRFFINVGRMDGASKSDLLDFLADESGLKKGDFDEVVLNDTHSFFQVKKENIQSIEGNFGGLEVEGRTIRIDRDDDTGGRSAKSGGRSSGSRGRSGGGRRDHRGGGRRSSSDRGRRGGGRSRSGRR